MYVQIWEFLNYESQKNLKSVSDTNTNTVYLWDAILEQHQEKT